jgi:hypothetical protein
MAREQKTYYGRKDRRYFCNIRKTPKMLSAKETEGSLEASIQHDSAQENVGRRNAKLLGELVIALARTDGGCVTARDVLHQPFFFVNGIFSLRIRTLRVLGFIPSNSPAPPEPCILPFESSRALRM